MIQNTRLMRYVNVYKDYRRSIFYILYPTNLLSTITKTYTRTNHWYLETDMNTEVDYERTLAYLQNDPNIEEMYDSYI